MSCTHCATIVVSFNGEHFAIHTGMTLALFLEGRGFTPEQRMACAVNAVLVSKVQYVTRMLNNGDRIDVIAPAV